MEERTFNERASGVLFFARYYSSPDGPRPVLPEHILLALLLVDPRLFQICLGTESDEVIRALKYDLRSCDPAVRRPWLATKVPELSAAAKDVIDLAKREALNLGHDIIGTEHFLLALISCADSKLTDDAGVIAGEALRRRGFSIEQIKERIRSGEIRSQQEGGRGYSLLVGRSRSSLAT